MKLCLLFSISLLITLLSFTPTHSLKCTSQTFTNNKLYKKCTDLPTLDSYLHYTYDADDSTLSVAFIAPPAKPDGWIAWGINPNGTGMAGTQALIAYKKSDGKMTVKTYNLVSYSQVLQTKLSFDVSDTAAEYSDGVMRIFAKFELPENTTTINQVWQVGASVNDEVPVKHAFDPVNLNSKGELKLSKNSTGAPSPSPTHSLKCTSQTFTNNKLYKNCTDLPTLDSYLHYTYDADDSTLSVAFIAPPAKPDGWIAWGINPNGTGMAGTQALIAYKKSNGKMTVKTYNLVSYGQVLQTKLSFDVSDLEAEYSDGVMRIFGKFELPENTTAINQVWQVGASVNDEVPVKHAFDPVNLNSKGELKLSKNSTGAPSPSPSARSEDDKDKKKNGSTRIIGDTRFGLCFVVLFSFFGILVL